MSDYKHGIDTSEKATVMPITATTAMAQVVIGTAPVHHLDDPASAVNTPILCENINDCYSKLGYSTKFAKFTLCQSMYVNFLSLGVAPVVFINVLDPAQHKTPVTEKKYAVNNKAITIDDDVIVSSLVIKSGETAIAKDKYDADWNGDILTVAFADDISGEVSVAYDKVDTTKVTDNDIIGDWNTETDVRTGAEVIKSIFPKLGAVPFIITAPGWSTSDTVGAILEAKAKEINGCYKAMAISDINSSSVKTRAAAIAAKKARALGENSIAVYPMVRKNGYIMAYSAWLSAIIMVRAAATDGVTCSSPSNYRIDIDDVVLADGTPVYYDQTDGNELNAEGIVTIIARNGWYTWGNNTAAYPGETDPVKRYIMTRLSFLWIENDFINSYFSTVDGTLSSKAVENIITDENIKLAGYIAGGSISYNAGDNTEADILAGHFTFRTALAANIPAEYITNIFSFDIDTLTSSILGGGAVNE